MLDIQNIQTALYDLIPPSILTSISPYAPYIFSSLLASALGGYLGRWIRGRARGLPLPPGPKGRPIIGNLLDMPSSYPGHTFEKMGKELNSDILYLNVAGTNIVVLNSFEACWDLLERRSSIYSSRPRFPMVVELMGWDKDFIVLPYGNEWKIRRKLFHQEFPLNITTRHEAQQLKVNRIFLKNLLHNPENYSNRIRHMTGSLIVLVTYGIDVKPEDDPVIDVAEKALDVFLHALSPGTFAVDALPWLKYVPDWIPGAGFKRQAKEWKKLNRRLNVEPFEIAKRQIENGTAPPSFVSNALSVLHDDPKGCGYTEDEIMHTAASMYEAGTDTVYTGLLTFILAMVNFPEYQRKAQQEIDRIVGAGRLPDFRDREALVYVEAILQEVQRWQPIGPVGVVHYIHTEDEYRGYRIPKDSTVIPNAWAILHDEEMYPDPYRFNPERWIKDGKINPEIRDITAGFGFGRRICPGRHLALATIYITIATTLAAFDITKAVDENGVPIEPKIEFISLLQNRPAPFRCSIKPRSAAHEKLILEAAEHDYH